MTIELIVNLSGLRQRGDSSKRIKSTSTLGTFSVPASCAFYNHTTTQYKLVCAYTYNIPLVKSTRGMLSCAC